MKCNENKVESYLSIKKREKNGTPQMLILYFYICVHIIFDYSHNECKSLYKIHQIYFICMNVDCRLLSNLDLLSLQICILSSLVYFCTAVVLNLPPGGP